MVGQASKTFLQEIGRPPLHAVAREGASPDAEQGNEIVGTMVAALRAGHTGSTSDALALLRRAYPDYPLALRLTALALHAHQQQPLDSARRTPSWRGLLGRARP